MSPPTRFAVPNVGTVDRVSMLVDDEPDEVLGDDLLGLVRELWPLPRSITGDGVRETLGLIGERIPLAVTEVPTGTHVLDWEIPNEWNLNEAWIEDESGVRVIDTARSNLHVVGYSRPVDLELSREELLDHVHTLPDRPQLVPYKTSYYQETWGFCMSHEQLTALPRGRYRVHIDTRLAPGGLTYAECVVPGHSTREVLVSSHVCHPSLANDNLSGISVATGLAEALLRGPRPRYTYRFLFIPGTIGSITWLAGHEAVVGRIAHGVVLSGVGDRGPLTWKRSRRGDAVVDRAAAHVLAELDPDHAVLEFTPYGYDERQFCSPGFDLPVGRLSRTPHGTYPEYHTSGDDLDFVSARQLGGALRALATIVTVLEGDGTYRNTNPKGEPQLGRRGLYRTIGGGIESESAEMALLWVLNQSDGKHSLLDIAIRSSLPFRVVRRAADALLEANLLAPVVGD